MSKGLLIFDMEGVLVDVSDSYREAIVRTVVHFTGRVITAEQVQEYENRGGWNDDWMLTHRLCTDLGAAVGYEAVVDRFVRIFAGERHDGDGLIRRERWIPRPGLLERIAQRFDLGIFSGRRRRGIDLSLRRFALQVRFDPCIGAEDVADL